jgi:hypothetical protein
MPRTISTISFGCVLLAAFAVFAEARADRHSPRPTPAACEITTPLIPQGLHGPDGTRRDDCIIGGDGTTGPTFPRWRADEARSAMLSIDMEAKHV